MRIQYELLKPTLSEYLKATYEIRGKKNSWKISPYNSLRWLEFFFVRTGSFAISEMDCFRKSRYLVSSCMEGCVSQRLRYRVTVECGQLRPSHGSPMQRIRSLGLAPERIQFQTLLSSRKQETSHYIMYIRHNRLKCT